jgi:hypothetical protein
LSSEQTEADAGMADKGAAEAVMGAAATNDDDMPTWLLPTRHGDPATCLQRIRWICQNVAELHTAMVTVVATHPGVPRERLADALKLHRPDLRAHSAADVLSLINGLWNGSRDGFDAVLRTRKNSERKGGGMPFLRPD